MARPRRRIPLMAYLNSLLAAVGRDCVGALQFLPKGRTPSVAGTVAGRVASERDIARLIRELGQKPLGIDKDEAFRISIAGGAGRYRRFRK